MGTKCTPSLNQVEAWLGPDALTEALRAKVREMIMTLVDAEVAETLAACPYERTDVRRGSRHGSKVRTLTTGFGKTARTVPRPRLLQDGQEVEWQSHLVPRSQRRAGAVDAALFGVYCAGANSRRIRGALAPLLHGAPLSKNAISRIVGRLKALFDRWRQRSLAEDRILIVYLDAIALRVRIAQRVVSVPVLVALGVQPDGQKVILDLALLASESTAAWGGLLAGLIERGVRRPKVCVIDGSKRLRAAIAEHGPGMVVQRCPVHQLRNVERHVPRHAVEEVRADYHRIVWADSLAVARQAPREVVATWTKRAPKMAASLQEAGDELLTLYRFPRAQWKSLRTTNVIERVHGEFRRRVKTQGSLPTAQAAELLLFALIVNGQIRMRRIDGWQDLGQLDHTLSTTGESHHAA